MPKLREDGDKVTGRFRPGHAASIRHAGYSTISKNMPLAVRRQVQGVREQLIRDIGGAEPALTAAQAILIDKTVNLYQITLCLEAYVRREGPFRGKKLDPVLGQNYLAYVNTIRLNLRELGIARKAGDEILSPLQLAEQIDKEQAEQEAQEAEKRAEKPQDERSPASEGQRLCSFSSDISCSICSTFRVFPGLSQVSVRRTSSSPFTYQLSHREVRLLRHRNSFLLFQRSWCQTYQPLCPYQANQETI